MLPGFQQKSLFTGLTATPLVIMVAGAIAGCSVLVGDVELAPIPSDADEETSDEGRITLMEAAFTGQLDEETVTTPTEIPPIDRDLPERIETATFALG